MYIHTGQPEPPPPPPSNWVNPRAPLAYRTGLRVTPNPDCSF